MNTGIDNEPHAIAFDFEAFVLEAARRALRQGDGKVELRAVCYHLRICPLDDAGRIVARHELMAAIWFNLGVTDKSLTRWVSDIRQAPCDADRCISKSVPRRGSVLVSRQYSHLTVHHLSPSQL